ncbi:nuclear pore complex protein NUP85 [Andrographis paniculata]|uniref:nuclear pore complex protein NUP85 n=1 Tax=Andrographis paniculata TaxID=175694 RepID=UPI0021E798C1|nr:nuclear pore complex protein NUP85 [Andrographis paniculata]XP_051129635.1 nuclear pore complex protein NUP85 [Andrographis paniculata]XP_051129636.1 nuclear pore complex protein NUP85 [Andrographis paniculata]
MYPLKEYSGDMPGLTSESGALAVVPHSSDAEKNTKVYHLRVQRVTPPFSRVSISWARGSTLRISLMQSEQDVSEQSSGGEVLEVRLGSADAGEISDAQWRRIAYGSVAPFALLQSRKNSASMMRSDRDWWEHALAYSKEINSLLGNSNSPVTPTIEDPRMVLKKVEEPTALKAAWELMEIFYVDKRSQSWMPERLLDWIADFDCLFSGTHSTVHAKLISFQNKLVTVQAVENDPEYWEAMSSALAVGWLDVVVKLLRLHGSYQYDQLGSREIENGLVEAVALLISQMPRLRPDLPAEKLGECYKTKPEFMKAWEKWRGQITKLDCSRFWLDCDHQKTRAGLKNMLQIMVGNASILTDATCHWIELYVAHFLYIRPFTMSLESMYSLAQKCMQLKSTSNQHKLMELMIGILEENIEVVLAECSRSFGPWMLTHAIELLTAGSMEAETLLHEPQSKFGGICIEELHRLIYAQILSSHALTWNIAPIYLTSCMMQGLGLLENLLSQQPVQHQQVLLKSIEICRLNGLDYISNNMMKIAGVNHWKHGKKGSAVFWLQQARDEVRLNRIAKHLFDFVGQSVSDKSFKQWEGMIELLGTESKTAGGLEFLKKYRDFRRSLQQVQDGITTDGAWKAAEALISLMKNPATPRQFWLPLLYDSLKLLEWKERPLLNVSQTNLLLNKLQELSLARLLPGFVDPVLPPEALQSVRLALATNLGRAILEE